MSVSLVSGATEWWNLPRENCQIENDAASKLAGEPPGTYMVWDISREHSMLSYVNAAGRVNHELFGFDTNKGYVRLGIYWGTTYTANSGTATFDEFVRKVVGPKATLFQV